ncbi:S-layer homology domain-containing protein [Zhaonella formicivorans]|uniref:S-layer homology domain-containing protein n=1 Tax=Zhaonella formicivorans TaxID=2528593 RepID=UPI0010E6C3E5|nr:S-layer homology domain-containing protein [Zhaonella formicivorans]
MKKSLAIFFLAVACLTVVPLRAKAALPEYYGMPEAAGILKQVQFTDTKDHWAKEPIAKMAAQGIIRGVGNNKFKPEGSLTKEQAIILLVRALGQASKAEALAEALAAQNGTQEKNFNSYLIEGYLATAVEAGVLTEPQRAALEAARIKPAQRQEVAYWTAKALGLNPVYGERQKLIHGFSDVTSFEPSYLPAVESLLQEKLMSGVSSNRFNPQGAIKRGEMAALLDRINPRLAEKRGLTLESGYVINKEQRQENLKVQKATEIKTDSGGRFLLVTGPVQGLDREVVVYKNGKLGDSSLLAAGDRVSVLVEGNNKVSFIQAWTNTSRMVFGQLKSIDPGNSELTVLNPAGVEQKFSVAKTVPVIIDNRPASLQDLLIGQDLTLTLNGSTVGSIKGTLGPELPGYTPPQSGVITGRLKEVGSGTLLILNDNGQQEEYRITSGTWVSKGGAWKDLSSLQMGDRVKLYLRDVAAREVDKIEVSGSAGKVVRIIKGRMEQIYPEGLKIALSGVKEFYYGQWYPAQGFDFVNLAPDVRIFAGGRAISPEELGQQFKGSEIYLAFTDSFGRHEGVQLVVKNGVAGTFSDKIEKIDWGAGRIELEHERLLLNLNPGTIVVRNGKLVDGDDLTDYDRVFMETNGTGNEQDVVVLSTANFYPAEFKFYRGRISSVDENEYELDSYSRFEDNEWDSVHRGDVDLSFDNDTVIVDTTLAANREIAAGKFAESRWSRYYDSDYYVFAVTQGEKTTFMTLWDYYSRPGVLKTSIGRVTAVNSGTKRLELDRVSDWSESYDQWRANNFPLSLDLSNAIIYKDDLPITVDDLKTGDSLYLIHDQLQGIIVFVQ